MCAVDHDHAAICPGLGELDEDPGEHALAGPEDETVVECCRRSIDGRRAPPL